MEKCMRHESYVDNKDRGNRIHVYGEKILYSFLRASSLKLLDAVALISDHTSKCLFPSYIL